MLTFMLPCALCKLSYYIYMHFNKQHYLNLLSREQLDKHCGCCEQSPKDSPPPHATRRALSSLGRHQEVGVTNK